MKNVETISLDLSKSKEIWFTTKICAQMKKVFFKMKKLRLLKVYYSDHDSLTRKVDKMGLPIGFEFPPNLRYLHWEGLESLPSNFHGENLVAINMNSSNIKELWEGYKRLAELKFLDLSNSQQLMKMLKFSSMPKLERLNLEGCTSFCNLHLSIGAFPEMKFLRELNFSGTGIKELPSSIGSLPSLEILDLSNCSKFEKFPDIFANMRHLRKLDFSGTGIKELPSSIGYLESLESLILSYCLNFEKFPEIQGNLKCLKNLYLDNTAIKEVPNSIGYLNMGSLRSLSVSGTAIKELPCSIGHLTGLSSLNLQNCKNLSGLPSSIYGLKYLEKLSLSGCSNVEAFSEIMVDMEHLHNLYLYGMVITELPSSIERLKNLSYLQLSNCENLVTLPNSIGNLTCLHTLLVHNCPKLHKLPDSLRGLQRCLRRLDVGGCNLMEGAIPIDLWCLSSLQYLDVSDNHIRCIPTGINQLSKLKELYMNHCLMLEEIPELPSSLRLIYAHGCPRLATLSSDPTHLLWSSLLNNFKLKTENLRRNRDEFHSKIHIIIPGSSGIPKWISNKSMGCEVRIELPKNWYKDDSFLGFALFFHHLPLDDDEEYCEPMHHGWCFELSISHGDQSELMHELSRPFHCRAHYIAGIGDGYVSLNKVGTSDPALYVLYFPQIFIPSKCRSRQWNNFKARCDGSYQCGNNSAFKLNSCGVHLIYAQAQDHQQKISSHDHPAEDHPHHKRSRHV